MQESALPITEQENERTTGISSLPTIDVLHRMNDEDHLVAAAVENVLPEIALAVDAIATRLGNHGRLFYIGTGTSGRLGVLDAVECPPTFGVSPNLIQGIIAGGYDALFRAVEASEDDAQAGARDLDSRGLNPHDAVVGLAASGRTPYTVGAVRHARAVGAFTAAVTCVPDSAITREAEVNIVPVTGPEAIAGSTRLKAGTAQKMVLNMISTATLIRLGYVSGNRMTNLKARNSKLRERAIRILESETGFSAREAGILLEAAGYNLPLALVMQRTGLGSEEAENALDQAEGRIEVAVKILNSRAK